MGQQGHGKGRKIENIVVFDEESSTDDPFSDDDDGIAANADYQPDLPRHKKAKKTHESDDDFEYVARSTASSRKTRRGTRSAQKAMSSSMGNRISLGSPVPTRTTRQTRNSQNRMQSMHSSPIVQQAEQNKQSNDLYHGYSYNDGSYASSPQDDLPQMVEEHSREIFGHLQAYHLDPRHHSTSYSSATDPIYSDDLQGKGETDANGFCNGSFDIFGSH